MSSQFKASFKVAAEKVVLLKEMQQTAKELRQSNLSILEKAYFALVDIPTSVALGISLGVQTVSDKTLLDGMYVDDQGNSYTSGAALTRAFNFEQKFGLKNKTSDKIAILSAKAFEQSEDHSDKLRTGQLKPLAR